MPNAAVIKTSEPDWGAQLAACYKKRAPFELVDDANLGIDPLSQSLRAMVSQSSSNVRIWWGVLGGLGVGWATRSILAAALVNPEPQSKVIFSAVGSALLLMGGGSVVYLLTGLRPNIELGPLKFGFSKE